MKLIKPNVELVKEAAKEQGQSFNGYVEQAIRERYLRDTGKEMEWKKEK